MSWLDRPTLVGELVRLEPLSVEHAGALFEAYDESVFAHLRGPVPRNVEEMRELVVRPAIEAHERGGKVPWAQIDIRAGLGRPARAVGVTTYWNIDPTFRSVEIGGTWLGRAWWRTGINTEAKFLLLQRAFEELDAVRVTWQTDIRNERSQAAIARLGATREGVLRRNRPRRDGDWRDSVLYSMTDEDWPIARTRLLDLLARHREKVGPSRMLDAGTADLQGIRPQR